MKRPAVDLEKREGSGQQEYEQGTENERNKVLNENFIHELVVCENRGSAGKEGHELPDRDRADDLVFYIDELWYNKLLHGALCP
jgi:hypothetical protein